MVAKVLSMSPASGYELMYEAGFPVLQVGGHMVVPGVCPAGSVPYGRCQ